MGRKGFLERARIIEFSSQLYHLIDLSPFPMPLDLIIVTLLRWLLEIAGFFLLGQGVLALLAGKQRNQNVFYQVLQVVTAPVIKTVRYLTPRQIIDAHIPLLTFFVVFWLWLALAFAKRSLCATHGLQC